MFDNHNLIAASIKLVLITSITRLYFVLTQSFSDDITNQNMISLLLGCV